MPARDPNLLLQWAHVKPNDIGRALWRGQLGQRGLRDILRRGGVKREREREREEERDVGRGVRWGAGGGRRCAPGDARAGGADGGADSQRQAGKFRGSALPARAGGWRCAGGWEAQKAGAWDGPSFVYGRNQSDELRMPICSG